jgi:hypothetical protein
VSWNLIMNLDVYPRCVMVCHWDHIIFCLMHRTAGIKILFGLVAIAYLDSHFPLGFPNPDPW